MTTSGLEVSHCVITGNGYAVVSEKSSQADTDNQVIHDSTLCDNTKYDIVLESQYDLGAPGNWWCTTDPNEIADRIHDVYDDANLGRVQFEPFLEQAP